MDKARVLEIAKTLDISYDEALEMLAEDKEVDRMKDKDVTSDISEEHKKTIKKYTNVGRGREVESVDAYGKKKKRTVKDDDVKQMLITLIAESLEDSFEIKDINITNKQKTIAFKVGDDDFEIDLKRKRKPKK